ncbi:MAG: hypothetical protein RLY31_2171 [Bacteroidota bacterium]
MQNDNEPMIRPTGLHPRPPDGAIYRPGKALILPNGFRPAASERPCPLHRQISPRPARPGQSPRKKANERPAFPRSGICGGTIGAPRKGHHLRCHCGFPGHRLRQDGRMGPAPVCLCDRCPGAPGGQPERRAQRPASFRNTGYDAATAGTGGRRHSGQPGGGFRAASLAACRRHFPETVRWRRRPPGSLNRWFSATGSKFPPIACSRVSAPD